MNRLDEPWSSLSVPERPSFPSGRKSSTVRSSPAMCCLILAAGLLGPRIALLLWWIFGDRVDVAFDSWVWPFLGLIFLPWTTLAYVLVWSPVVGVDGGEWIVVALGFVVDVATYSSRAAQARYRASRAY
jgi:hypothetical protein